jgi:eukaryotic-like serine/threonine-protein kinase
MTANSARAIEIFTEAIQLPKEEQSAFLDRACAGNEGLRQKIESLLRSNDRAAGFLEQPPTKEIGDSRAKTGAGEKAGDRIGHFRLLEQIGEGGCGIVFKAEQEEPVRRRVALKVIKPGMDTKSVIARFEAERQALALMDHPNIAHVFEAGATESGRPYFVMELVEGVKITDYCDRHSLPIGARLELFVQVCDAIQHAHQKGIIHRDIKPSNILATTGRDGKPTPKVIDFGIAKATMGQQLTDKTIFTAQGMLIGTPAYMSPEQAAITSTDVDTRTDIYGLGVLLYELLTGTTPFDTRELLKVGFDEIRRVIRDEEPVRPSTRLSTMIAADLVNVSKHHGDEAPKLIREMRGDLDWIVMKALEKDRNRRYATANGLALDIQRYLANEAVSARPPSKLYKFQKTVLRNKLLFTGVGIIAVLLVASLIVVSASLANERRSRREAEEASAKSREVTKFLEDMLQGVGPSVALGEDTRMLRRILDQTVDRVGKEMAGQPLVEAELRNIIGALYEELGHADKGEEMVRKALEIYRIKLGSDSLEVAATLNLLGHQFGSQGKFPEAKQAFSEALAIRQRRLGDENADTATSHSDLAVIYANEGKLAEAEAMTREALRIRLKISGADTNNLAVADSLRKLCIILGGQQKWAEAEATARDVLTIRRKVLAPEHPLIAAALSDLAWAVNANGKYEEAQALQVEALVMKQKLLGDTHPDVTSTLSSLGKVLENRGDLESADAVLKAVLSIQRKLLGEQSGATFETMSSLGRVLAAQGKPSDAEAVWRELLSLWSKRGEDENPERLLALRGLGEALEDQGKWAEAEEVWGESLSLWRKRGGIEERESMYTLRKLGLALEAERKWPEAESVHREALTISSKRGDHDAEALVDLERLVRVLAAEKKFIEAQQRLDKVLTPEFVMEPPSANLLVQRVDLMGRRGRWPEAASDVGFLLQLQPSEPYHYHRLAALLAISQSRPAYEQLCQKIVATFTSTANPYVDERIAQDCLLMPNSGVNLELIDKLADAAVTLGSGEDSLPYFQACKAMSNYRLGDFREAIEWADKVAKNPKAEVQAKAKAFAVLAMAHGQLGQKDVARAMLTQGDRLAPNILPAQNAEDLGESWVAWLIARVSLDEATELIKTGSIADKNSSQP